MIRTILAACAAIVFAGVAAAQGSYQIQRGDTLQVEVLEDQSLNRSTLVLPDGSVTFPLAGTLRAAGRTVSDFQSALTNALAPNFASPPTVFVSVGQLAPEIENEVPEAETVDVYALGEFNNPGRFDLEPGTTLLQFIAASGGLTRFAATKRVQLRRQDLRTGQERVFQLNLRAIEQGAQRTGQLILQPGDVVVAPERRLFE
jgi:polysaccharide export outer membrane protein